MSEILQKRQKNVDSNLTQLILLKPPVSGPMTVYRFVETHINPSKIRQIQHWQALDGQSPSKHARK
ncbi:hypothetical protein [Pseudomonas fluorescens]|uniref:hypothetical protein n=1 Tax=Pseudomonas fluorescens TaxID=294 RepID=UPI0012407328|nr:hypothetical protein [Pseudomonas fluorescens]